MTYVLKRSGMARGFAGKGGILVIAALTSGCASLPNSGPTARAIVKASLPEQNLMGFKIIEIEPSTSATLLREASPPEPQFALLAATGAVDAVGPGDVLDIRIFEVGPSLFSGAASGGGMGEQFDSSARNQLLQGVVVNRNGAITLPYIGQLRVVGQTTAEIERMVSRGLRGMSQSPQVLVTVRENVSNTVVVSGAVQRPGRQILTLARSRLLDAIAEAGGVGTQAPDMTVRFTRNGRSIEQPLMSIRSGEPNDLILLPGDRIEVVREPRSFTAFGATKVAQVQFETATLSLAEAIARSGGPVDTQADPTAVFVFRYSRAADGTPVVPTDPSAAVAERPIIYRLNMMQPSSYFLAQRFAMHDKDVIYVANARSNMATKLVSIVNQLFSPFFTLQTIARQ